MDVKFTTCPSSELNNVELINGQLIYLSDQGAAFYDMSNTRYPVTGTCVVNGLPAEGLSSYIYIDTSEDPPSLYIWDSDSTSFVSIGKTYYPGTGLTLAGGVFNHKNSVEAGTAKGDDSKTLSFGGTFTVPSINYDEEGHITSDSVTTMTMPNNPNTHWVTRLYAGTGYPRNAATTNGNTKLTITDDQAVRTTVTIQGSGSVDVSSDDDGVITVHGQQLEIVPGTGLAFDGNTLNHSNSVDAGTAKGDDSKTLTFGGTFKVPSVTYDAEGHITSKDTTVMTMPANPNTHYTTHLYAGSGDASNGATTNGNTKLTVADDSTARDSITVKGSGIVSVTSDANGNVTINASDSYHGTVTNVATGAGLTGGPITQTGTLKADLKSETKSSLAASDKTSQSGKEYAVGLDSAGHLSVNIPWEDTTYDVVSTSSNGLAPKVTSNGNFLKGDGTWSPVVTGVKGDNESTYRTGNVNLTKANIGLSNVGNYKAVSTLGSQGLTSQEQQNARDNIDLGTAATRDVGSANGVAELGSDGKVLASQLPSYVSNIVEYPDRASFPAVGTNERIYVDMSTGKTYRWGGTEYATIFDSVTLGETSQTAFRGDYGKIAYDHALAKGTAFANGLYKITTNAQGHVTSATAVTKSDITSLGIPSQDTTYSANNGVSLSGTTFSNSGVRSVATGTSNGTISVNTNGTTANVAVKGLGSAAYTASTNYVAKAGDTMTGDLTISKSSPVLHLNNTSNVAAKANSDIIEVQYKNSNGTATYKVHPIAILGTDGTATYNAGVRIGSDTGTTIVGAGESSANFASAQGKYNDEDLYLVSDAGIHMYKNMTNEGALGIGPLEAAGFSGTITGGRVVVTDGTTGAVKSSSYTIAKSVPSDAIFTDTTYGIVSTSANGIAPKITNTSGYLKGDGTWTVPPNTTYSVVSTTANGLAPKVTDTAKFLRGDGTWQTPKNTTYNVVSETANGLAPKVTDTSGFLKGDGTWATPPTTSYTTMTQAQATAGTSTTAQVITAKVLRGSAVPIMSSAPSYATLADLWTAAEGLMTNSSANTCVIRCKLTADFGMGTGWYRLIISCQNKVGGGSDVAGSIVKMSAGALAFYKIAGGKTDTSDLTATQVTIDDTHYTTHLYAGSGTAANKATTNGNTKITVVDNTTVRDSLTIKGTGATTVVSDANGVITVNSSDTTYSVVSTSKNGLAPKVTDTSKFLKGDGTWATPTNTTYSVVSTSANGLAPKVTDTSKFLRGDGTWQTPTNTTYSVVSSSANGLAPKVTDTSKFLKGDGTWATPKDTTYSVVSSSANGLAPKITSTSGFLKGDGTWTAIPTGVKGSAESSYRTGNVNITKANIGLGNVPNPTIVSATLAKNATSVTFSDAAITTSSTLAIFSAKPAIGYTAATVSAGSATYSGFPAQSSATAMKLYVF